MFRLLTLWRLRRAQARLRSEIDWLRDAVWTHQIRIEALEKRERAVQAELWCAEAPRALLPRRAGSGLSSRG